jgi:hypothetical protein
MFTKQRQEFQLPEPGQEVTYTFYSNSQDKYISVTVDDVPYSVAIRNHPTCINYQTYDIQFEVHPHNILELDFDSEFVPGQWIYPQVATELNDYLNHSVPQSIKDQLIKQELELCLA